MTETESPADADAQRLGELGYTQELHRGLRIADNVALGFATISPVVGLYAVLFVGMAVAGPAWIWVVPVALLGQCLLLAVYAELASEFPLAGGPYQWSRRLIGGAYGWVSGWVAVCSYAVANTTIAYLGAPWLLVLLGIDATPGAVVAAGALLVLVGAALGAFGVDLLGRAVRVGIVAEIVASVGVAVALLLAFREQDLAILTDTLGAEASSGGSVLAAMLAALAVAGWVFIGFDASVALAEETHDATRHVPRAIWVALLSVAAVVILNAVATTLAHPDLGRVVAGEDVDPVTTAVVSSFGSWSTKPFAAVVLLAFLACGTAAQALTARTVFSMARDDGLPGSPILRRVDRRGTPVGGIAAATAVALLGLLLGLEATAAGSLITFGTAAVYVSFWLVAVAALAARLRGSWVPSGRVRLGRLGVAVNVAAVAWLTFETINIAWPRELLAPPGAPWYQVWAAPLVLAVIGAVGGVYLAVAQPHRRDVPGA
ncbi:MAG: amino acid permease [Solirubrobacteraceae bacterium]|nr:amino acid permease [Solirubrobacteraceae bacterium]